MNSAAANNTGVQVGLILLAVNHQPVLGKSVPEVMDLLANATEYAMLRLARLETSDTTPSWDI